MKRKIAAKSFTLFLTGLLLIVAGASAQSIAYRQTNLASDINTPGFSNHTDLGLQNSWGLALVPGLSFFVANTKNGHVLEYDAAGLGTGPVGFTVHTAAGNATGSPTGVVADPDSIFGPADRGQPFIISILSATQDGGVYSWVVDSQGNFLNDATLLIDHSRDGAVYTSLAILKPACCAPILAVANFHTGRVETYSTAFAPLGSFLVPNPPPGFAPYGMQVIGNQLFITSALQDAAKHDPVPGAGNGVVSIFDLEGHFVRQFASAGSLNAPWGITQAGANFGPFSNDILIGNAGDGTISAFDPATGNFGGQLSSEDGVVIVNGSLHAIAFRSDGIGDPNTLYFTAGINSGVDGLLGAITPGQVSTTRVSVPSTTSGSPAAITVTVSAGPGNSGTPTGQVAVRDSGAPIANVALLNGMIVFPAVLNVVGMHEIEAQYEGDATFLPSSSTANVNVTEIPTAITLTAPTNVNTGSMLTLTVNANSTEGIPSGQITFHDGNTILGSVPLDEAAVAVLRVSTLAAGTHTFTASYSGEGKFGGGTSAPVVTTITGKDFSLSATPPAATVTAGQSASFNITVTSAGGFADPVTFSCPPTLGITCSFNPPMATPASGSAASMLTVNTSASVPRYGMTPGLAGFGFLFACLGLIAAREWFERNSRRPHPVFLRVAASAGMVIALALTLVSCGGYTTGGQSNRGTASVTVTAQSGAISHTTAITVTLQ